MTPADGRAFSSYMGVDVSEFQENDGTAVPAVVWVPSDGGEPVAGVTGLCPAQDVTQDVSDVFVGDVEQMPEGF